MKLESKIKLISDNFANEHDRFQAVIYVTASARQRLVTEKIKRLEPKLFVEAAFHDMALSAKLGFADFHVLVLNFSQFAKRIEWIKQFCDRNRVVISFDDDKGRNQGLDEKCSAAIKTVRRFSFEGEPR